MLVHGFTTLHGYLLPILVMHNYAINKVYSPLVVSHWTSLAST